MINYVVASSIAVRPIRYLRGRESIVTIVKISLANYIEKRAFTPSIL